MRVRRVARMREIPRFTLNKAAIAPGQYNLVGTDGMLKGIVLGFVYKDVEFGHSGLYWRGRVQLGDGDVDLGFFSIRQYAVENVARQWRLIQDEREAHRIHDARTFEAELPTSLEWERRVKELAEELGRAQAHAIPNSGLHYRRVDDGELLEETVFAARSLRRQRDKVPFDVDALRTAAFAYQFAMNASHQRALADVKHHSQAVVFTAGMREVENVWES